MKMKKIKIDKEDQKNCENLMENKCEIDNIVSAFSKTIRELKDEANGHSRTTWIEMATKYKLDKNREHYYSKKTKGIIEYDIADFIPDKTEKEIKFKEELDQMEHVLSLMDEMTKKADELDKIRKKNK